MFRPWKPKNAILLNMEDISLFLSTHKSVIIILHAIGAAIGVGTATLSDFTFFNFLKDGSISAKESSVFRIFTRTIWIALAILVLSGIALFLSDPGTYTQSAKFIVKMIIVLVLVLNGLFMTFFLHGNMRFITFASKKHRMIKRVSFASGAISISSWYLAFLLGSFRSIPITVGTALLVYLGILIVGVISSQMLYKRYERRYRQEVNI